MNPVVIAAGAASLIYWLLSKRKGDGAPDKQLAAGVDPDSPLMPDFVKEATKSGSAAALDAAAARAQREGHTRVAAAVKRRADGLRIEQARVYRSPLGTLANDAQWTQFVNANKAPGGPRSITPSFGIGWFAFGAKRLVDLGMMSHPRRGTYRGRSVWTGTWKPGLNINKFLADSLLQYRLFSQSMARYASMIMQRYRPYIGRTVDGRRITLSGLMAVARYAGPRGLSSWLQNPAIRRKFTKTTEAFARLNGLF